MRNVIVFICLLCLFACVDEKQKSDANKKSVKKVKKEKFTQLDDILFVDNEFRPNQDLYFELFNEFKGNFEMRRLTYSIVNKELVLNFIMHDSGN